MAAFRSAFKSMVFLILSDMLDGFLAILRSKYQMPGSLIELDRSEIDFLHESFKGAILGGPWVLMENYGRGSQMDEDNLFRTGLNYLLNPDLWNETREDLAIRTRERPYTNIFGEKVESTGNDPPPGINIEHLPGFEPWRPTYHLEDTMDEFLMFESKAIINNRFLQFPWYKFIRGTRSRMRE